MGGRDTAAKARNSPFAPLPPWGWAVLTVAVGVFLWSSIGPKDRLTWWMEVFPALAAGILLLLTRRRFPLTPLVYTLVAVHACILFVGGHYTYAEVPAFTWLKESFGLARNYYDRVGHFAQGFVPAVAAREILLRTSPLRRGKWTFFLVTCVCLAVSACYEFLEWWSAVIMGQGADAFLGTQGDVWDTQWDMFLCLIGALCALMLLSRWHDRQLEKVAETGG